RQIIARRDRGPRGRLAPVSSLRRPTPVDRPRARRNVMDRTISHLDVDSPLGQLRIFARDSSIVAIHLPHRANVASLQSMPDSQHSLLREAAAQLDAWFACRRKTFALPLAAEGTG